MTKDTLARNRIGGELQRIQALARLILSSRNHWSPRMAGGLLEVVTEDEIARLSCLGKHESCLPVELGSRSIDRRRPCQVLLYGGRVSRAL